MTPESPVSDLEHPDDGREMDDARRSSFVRRVSSSAPRWLGIVLAIAISAFIFLFRDHLIGLAAYGYVGLFLLNLAASATLFLPMPGLALAFVAGGSSLSPLLVGLAVGSGSALGELTGYLVGASGRAVIEDKPRYQQIQGWMKQYGLWVIFVLSLIPSPLFDIAGMIAGAMRIPVWKFLLACGAGKVIKSTLIAYAGAGTMSVVGPAVQRWFSP
jgi:uncharacterized membrane protein YdjX (TVP38/TMEM64 family)